MTEEQKKAIDEIDRLKEDVQGMREEGNTDLRTVLFLIDEAKKNIISRFNKEEP